MPNNPKPIRIGTRSSQLALWQANQVKQGLEAGGATCELLTIDASADVDLVTPLYAMGVQGVFTRQIDAAQLAGQVDIAVHSLKDVPVALAQGLSIGAILERASYKDLLVYNGLEGQFLPQFNGTIASSSLRRRAQWLHRYPQTRLENLRGNINTRLRKLNEGYWSGAIFAAAGLERINLRPVNALELNWMLPAPAQGAVVAVVRTGDMDLMQKLKPLNHPATVMAVAAERDFLSTLHGGCSAPVAAHCILDEERSWFKGRINSQDGAIEINIERDGPAHSALDLAQEAASYLLKTEGEVIRRILNRPGL